MHHSMNGVRGWASLVVFVYHSVPLFYPVISTQKHGVAKGYIDLFLAKSPLYVLTNGTFAVFVFFVLSGFVLSVKFFEEKSRIYVVSSMLRRYFRLAIPVFASSLIIVICIRFNLFHENEMVKIGLLKTEQQRYIFQFYFHDIFQESLIRVFTERSALLNLVLWTMQYELVGSYIVFLFIILFGTSRLRFAMYFIFLAFAGKTGYYVIYYKCFIFGVVLADIYTNFPAIKRLNKIFSLEIMFIFTALSGLALGSMPMYIEEPSAYQKSLQYVMRGVNFDGVYALGSCLVVLGVLFSKNLERIFSSKVSLFLGRVSFSIYLLHISIIFTFGYYLFSILEANKVLHDFAFVIYFVLTTFFAITVSHYFEKFIDRPINGFSQKVVWKVIDVAISARHATQSR
ncbi:MAG: acyltransferase [Magnetococcales bacterium]|nr:acyltransferase [Magnetococcales bacterium]